MKLSSFLAGVLACAAATSVAAFSATVSGDPATKPVTLLDQGWSPEQRDLFYYTSQGTFVMPAAWLEALEDAGPRGGRFMAPANVARFGLIAGEASSMNPYGWPVGIAIDTENKDGIPQAGATCAFCHTGQLDFRGRSVRIDGGRSNLNQKAFAEALVRAVNATATEPTRRARFMQAAVRLGYPKDRIEADFDAMYRWMSQQSQESSLDQGQATPAGPGRLDAIGGIATTIFVNALGEKSNARVANAPVVYPYLWDMWQFDYAQYNASLRQPMGRDVLEAMGHPGVVGLIEPTTGELLPHPDRWQTTIRVRNLYALRTELDTLKPPPWPEDVLGQIDRAKAAQGRELFTQNCAGCHGIKIIKGTTDPTEWHVPVVRLEKIGTDPKQAVDFAAETFDATKLGLGKHTSLTAALGVILPAIKRQAYLNAGVPESEWAEYDGFGRKDDSPDRTLACGYRARPLVGVWATGPFLHNGSVPTIYDLLSGSRPASFVFGSREFDPHKLGFSQEAGINTMALDTKLPGNSNAGHWFTDDASRPGRIGPALTETEKFAIIEYLKAATQADYPTVQIAPPGPAPCTDDPDWAKQWRSARAN